jgi:TIR domain
LFSGLDGVKSWNSVTSGYEALEFRAAFVALHPSVLRRGRGQRDRPWGKNLAEELQRIYMTASNVVVMFVSEDYARKSWPRHERQSALARALEELREYILPVRFDDTVLPGLDPSVKALTLENRPPAKLAENIMAKLVQLGGRVEPPKPSFRVKDANDDDGNVSRVIVHDENGGPVKDASVLLVAQNGTASQDKTGPDGVAEIPAQVRRKVAVFVAHPQHRAAFCRQHDNWDELHVTLPAGAGAHSVIFTNTGHTPGFRPRLNPIGDAHDGEGLPRRTYMYVDNGSVDGRAGQPFHFRVGKPMMLEDSEGTKYGRPVLGSWGEARCGSTNSRIATRRPRYRRRTPPSGRRCRLGPT